MLAAGSRTVPGVRSSAARRLIPLLILTSVAGGLLGSDALSARKAGATVSRGPRRCGATLNFVGLTLSAAKTLGHRCHQSVGYVYSVPDANPAGTIVSQSQPSGGNRLVVSTGPLTNARSVLPLAAGPPVATECTATLRLDEDGNAGPLTCHGIHVNVEAWDYFARIHAPIMSLARHETVCQVAKVIGLYYVSGPVSYSVFELANVYNGWHVPGALAGHILMDNPYHDPCKNELHSHAP